MGLAAHVQLLEANGPQVCIKQEGGCQLLKTVSDPEQTSLGEGSVQWEDTEREKVERSNKWEDATESGSEHKHKD